MVHTGPPKVLGVGVQLGPDLDHVARDRPDPLPGRDGVPTHHHHLAVRRLQPFELPRHRRRDHPGHGIPPWADAGRLVSTQRQRLSHRRPSAGPWAIRRSGRSSRAMDRSPARERRHPWAQCPARDRHRRAIGPARDRTRGGIHSRRASRPVVGPLHRPSGRPRIGQGLESVLGWTYRLTVGFLACHGPRNGLWLDIPRGCVRPVADPWPHQTAPGQRAGGARSGRGAALGPPPPVVRAWPGLERHPDLHLLGVLLEGRRRQLGHPPTARPASPTLARILTLHPQILQSAPLRTQSGTTGPGWRPAEHPRPRSHAPTSHLWVLCADLRSCMGSRPDRCRARPPAGPGDIPPPPGGLSPVLTR